MCFLSSAVRCQPLSRALCNSGNCRGSIFWDFSSYSFCFVLSANELFNLKFVVNSSSKTGKVLCLPQSVLALVRCKFSGRKVWKGQVYRAFCTCWKSCSVSLSNSKAWFVAERWTLFWRLIYHGSYLGWFLNHSTIAIVAFVRVKLVYLIEFA